MALDGNGNGNVRDGKGPMETRKGSYRPTGIFVAVQRKLRELLLILSMTTSTLPGLKSSK